MTTAHIVFEYEGKRYNVVDKQPYRSKCGIKHDAKMHKWHWEEGNGSCDCNRSDFIASQNPDFLEPDMDCGGKIKLISIEIRERDGNVVKTNNKRFLANYFEKDWHRELAQDLFKIDGIESVDVNYDDGFELMIECDTVETMKNMDEIINDYRRKYKALISCSVTITGDI